MHKISDISMLLNMSRIDDADLSGLDLRDKKDWFSSTPQLQLEVMEDFRDFNRNGGDLKALMSKAYEAFDRIPVKGWTDNVIWPAPGRMPEGFDPRKILEEAKAPSLGVAELHKKGITGRGVSIAIIDARLNREHPDYRDSIAYYGQIGNSWAGSGPDYHGSLVVGNAMGKTTGVAPDAKVYYFAAESKLLDKGRKTTDSASRNRAIADIIRLNGTLSEDRKIRFLSCSWGTPEDLHADERDALFHKAEDEGIMVIGGFYDMKMTGIAYNPFDISNPRPPPRNLVRGKDFLVPTDGKTTPFYKGGYVYERLGGSSSTFPYLAGVFALALQA
ncbi:MAG: S8/S53 family peptidase, partial [Rickettsiales bacterium]|nr:S8/S53 family peptidase [Rickettsiales bacterium]